MLPLCRHELASRTAGDSTHDQKRSRGSTGEKPRNPAELMQHPAVLLQHSLFGSICCWLRRKPDQLLHLDEHPANSGP